MSFEIESWMTSADVVALQVFEPLREKAERAVADGGNVPYWLGYVAGITDAMLGLTHHLPPDASAVVPPTTSITISGVGLADPKDRWLVESWLHWKFRLWRMTRRGSRESNPPRL